MGIEEEQVRSWSKMDHIDAMLEEYTTKANDSSFLWHYFQYHAEPQTDYDCFLRVATRGDEYTGVTTFLQKLRV